MARNTRWHPFAQMTLFSEHVTRPHWNDLDKVTREEIERLLAKLLRESYLRASAHRSGGRLDE